MQTSLSQSVRLGVFFIGLTSVAWAAEFAPAFWKFAPLEGLASQILRGENLPNALIEARMQLVEDLARSEVCWPKAMHNATIIRGRLVQIALDESDPKRFDDGLAAAEVMVRRSLSCAPADPFLWFTLFWLENLKNGYQEDTLRYLEKSYELGPNEGWIALKRNAYALTLYKALPAQLQRASIREFAALVNSGFVDQAASNLVGAGWPIHEQLLASLTDTRELYRRWLAVNLRRAGIEVVVPGIDLGETRPWQVD